MRKHLPNFRMAASAALLSGLFPCVHAQTLVFDGSNPDLLQTTSGGTVNSLFPTGTTGNTVLVTGGEIAGLTAGGYLNATNGDVSNNSLTITGGTLKGDAYGGRASNGNAINNAITVTGGTLNANAYGGSTSNGNAINNVITITGGTLKGVAYGGRTSNGNAINNAITVTGGTGNNIYAGRSNNGDAINNVATISGGAYVIAYGAFVASADTPNTASGNRVNMSGGSVSGVVAAYVNTGIVSNNSVTISGGNVTTIVYGGQIAHGDAINNTVTMTGGTVGGDIKGGHASTRGNNANNNTVIITGGKVNANIYGGWTVNNNAINNTVTLGSGAMLAAATAVYGGFNNNAAADAFTGNTLNLLGYSGSIDRIANFQNYYISLPASLQSGQPQVTVATPVDLNNTNIRVGVQGRNAILPSATIYTLFNNTTGTPNSVGTTALQGVSFLYDVSLVSSASSLQVAFSSPRLNAQTKSLSEAQAARSAMVELGADLSVGQGMRNAATAARDGHGLGAFAALGAGSSTLKTGSEINLHSVSLMLGASTMDGPLMTGAFFEYGSASYNASNSFSDAASVTANGNTDYYGLGLLGRYQLGAAGPYGAYLDGAVRIGSAKTSYDSNNLCSVDGQCASYSVSSHYFGGHVGAGMAQPLTQQAILDFSSRYLWNRVGGNDAQIAGDTVNFSGVTSSRWSNGLRLDYLMDNGMVPYASATYIYEFNGEANASIYGIKAAAPTLRGGTSIAEAGIRFHKDAASFDLALQDYAGQRQGWGGSVSYKYQF